VTGLWQKVRDFGRMIKFSHSVFALPFALASTALAAQGGYLTGRKVVLIVVAMVGARSAAMGFNRLADQAYDARNPRTAGRELPTGVLSRLEVWFFVLSSAGVFVAVAFWLNPLCFALSPVALFVILGYSYTKRFTPMAQLFLGLSLSIAPVGAWLAVRGSLSPVPVVLGVGVLLWAAGFDTLYACQDYDVDRAQGLHSLPARFGLETAFLLSRLMHVGAVLALGSVFLLTPLHPVYLAGVLLSALLLVYEHSLVSPGNLSRLNAAFFTVNGWISGLYFVTTLSAVMLSKRL
jgi:4-hydroxybenzoate polyprenyltransferase